MKYPVLILILVVNAMSATAQTEGARISGRVTDVSGAVIAGSECTITNIETNVSTSTTTNEDGIYVIPDLHPASYKLTIEKEGFRTVVQPSLQLYAQDAVNENFTLAIGMKSETINVVDNIALLQTDSPAVSTVVNQQFVDNMPLNGRSFQPLIALAPGVVFTSQSEGAGQFAVNGQRSDANYFMVDGVSANFGSAPGCCLGQSVGGAIPGFTSGGGTNGLVSVDAMQEFRIQTSSYAPEFGRTPGAQISIVTKSGTNQFHGTVYDYLRNDIFDARNYFDAPPLPKPPLRQNDFGGTLGGPIVKNKTFFFFSYEGLRLQMPQTALGVFFTSSARAAVAPVYRPIVNALPLPTGPPIDPTCDNITNPCLANITAAYSNPSVLNATSIRVDHSIAGKINLFTRYNHAPSYDANRYWEEVGYDTVNTDTLTVGATIPFTPTRMNDFRANWSRNTGTTSTSLTDFDGGVAPPDSVLHPPGSPYGPGTGSAIFNFTLSGSNMDVRDGTIYANFQRQLNFVDTFLWTAGAHQLKFGVDYRRLYPTSAGSTDYVALPSFQALVLGNATTFAATTKDPYSVTINNYSLFAQDIWKATSKLTLTYGLRWEINPPPESAISGKPLYSIQGIFDSNPLAIVPGALWRTRFGDVAPRIGAAYQVTPKTVVRGGFGLFYDLGYGNTGDTTGYYPYFRSSFTSLPAPGVPFDLTNPAFQPVPFSTSVTSAAAINGGLFAIDPNLRVPLTLEWNAAIERELGSNQKLTATYVGADARRLLREDTISPPTIVVNGNQPQVSAVWNGGYSHYEALQLQFQRRMTHGLQALVSYNLAKASDLGSNDGTGFGVANISQVVLPPLAPSDFDIRNSIAGAVSYEIPAPAWGRAGKAILKGWAVDGLVQVSSAPPITVTYFNESSEIGFFQRLANVVPGQPYWIPDSSQPAGRALNPAAFSLPATGVQGNYPRNSLRSPYSVDQTDLAVRRRFRLTDRLNLNVRAEYFNLFNHPMFGAPGFNQPNTELGISPFGKVGATTNEALGGGGAVGGQSTLYALGGPRSAQFTIKLQF
jgi:Carboxypeptidase regulatory-like domain/TonB dependent receptor/TonB-dependent Receptor Plug Domain